MIFLVSSCESGSSVVCKNINSYSNTYTHAPFHLGVSFFLFVIRTQCESNWNCFFISVEIHRFCVVLYLKPSQCINVMLKGKRAEIFLLSLSIRWGYQIFSMRPQYSISSHCVCLSVFFIPLSSSVCVRLRILCFFFMNIAIWNLTK